MPISPTLLTPTKATSALSYRAFQESIQAWPATHKAAPIQLPDGTSYEGHLFDFTGVSRACPSTACAKDAYAALQRMEPKLCQVLEGFPAPPVEATFVGAQTFSFTADSGTRLLAVAAQDDRLYFFRDGPAAPRPQVDVFGPSVDEELATIVDKIPLTTTQDDARRLYRQGVHLLYPKGSNGLVSIAFDPLLHAYARQAVKLGFATPEQERLAKISS